MKKLKKIDIHVHARLQRGIERPGTGGSYPLPQEVRALYDLLDIEKGLLLPGQSPEGRHYEVSNEEAIELVTRYPDTFYWFCSIDPRMGGNSPDTDLSYFINYYKQFGALGMGEVTCNLPFDDPRVLNLFRHCDKCGMPVLFHIGCVGDLYGVIDELGLPRLEKVLAMFPKVTFLGHSQKFWSEIGGDVTEETRGMYPKGRVTPGGRVVELLRRYPNLCGDLSAGSGANALLRDPEFAYAFIEEFQDRLFFGTDIADPNCLKFPMLRLAPFLDEAMETGRISYAAYEKVSRANALRLLSRAL